MTTDNLDQETAILGSDDDAIGVEVYDKHDIRHIVNVEWDGSVEKHTHESDTYPYKREERTEDEQILMTQVEERARFAAHKEFPDEEILYPMWDPAHIEAGIEAFGNYPRETFLAEFRPLYEAMRDPAQFIDDPEMDPETFMANLSVHFRDGEILDVSDFVFDYKRFDGSEHAVGSTRSIPADEELIIFQPYVEFADDFDFEQQFQGVVLSHLMAQIRDIYLNMGEDPPPQYQVEGVGKLDIVGDGIGNL